MAEQGGGRIVNVSSRGAFRGEPEAPGYAASRRFEMRSVNRWQKRWHRKAVYVFVVAPGWVSTLRVADLVKDKTVLADQPLGRVATPDEVAQVVTYCTLDAPASMTGAVLDVNGASYFTDLAAIGRVDRSVAPRLLFGLGLRCFDWLVVGIVTAAGARIRHDPQLLVLGVFHLEVRRFEFAQPAAKYFRWRCGWSP